MEKIPNANHEELPSVYDEEGRVIDSGIAMQMAEAEAPYHKGAGSHHATPRRIAQGNLIAEDTARQIMRTADMLERVRNVGAEIEEQERAKAEEEARISAEADIEAQKIADDKKVEDAFAAIMAEFDKAESENPS